MHNTSFDILATFNPLNTETNKQKKYQNYRELFLNPFTPKSNQY